MPSLFVIRGNDQGARFELDEPIIRLGRDKSCSLHVHDTEVSRQHAEFRRTHRDYTVSDLNSSNGTFVNGVRVQQQALASGDHVQVGATLMLYTGPVSDSSTGIDSAVSISTAVPTDDGSHIIHSMTQQEGSLIFSSQAELPQNSWLARAEQPPGNVPHGAGRQPHAGHRPVVRRGSWT